MSEERKRRLVYSMLASQTENKAIVMPSDIYDECVHLGLIRDGATTNEFDRVRRELTREMFYS